MDGGSQSSIKKEENQSQDENKVMDQDKEDPLLHRIEHSPGSLTFEYSPPIYYPDSTSPDDRLTTNDLLIQSSSPSLTSTEIHVDNQSYEDEDYEIDEEDDMEDTLAHRQSFSTPRIYVPKLKSTDAEIEKLIQEVNQLSSDSENENFSMD